MLFLGRSTPSINFGVTLFSLLGMVFLVVLFGWVGYLIASGRNESDHSERIQKLYEEEKEEGGD